MDVSLVEMAQRGDREAYELIARGSASRLYAIAHRILRDADRAEDVVQQALVAIWTEIPKLRNPARFQAWSTRLVVNFSLAESRRARSVRRVDLIDAEKQPRSNDDAAAVALREQLDRAFRRLSPEHRAVIVLHHYVGLSLMEIAETLAIPYGTVGSRLHYATLALRTALGVEDAEPVAGGQPA